MPCICGVPPPAPDDAGRWLADP